MNKLVFLSPVLGNLINFRRELILDMALQGYDITLICDYEQEFDEFTKAGVKYYKVSMDRRGINPLKELSVCIKYYSLLKEAKPDVVLTYTTKCSVYGGIICRLLKIPYIINNSGLFDPDRIGRLFGRILDFLHRLAYTKASCIMYQNKTEMKVLNKVLKNKVHYRLIPGSGVNLDRFKPLAYPEEDGKTKFLMICRIQKEKGVDEFLEAAEAIKGKYDNVYFNLLGRFDENYEDLILAKEKQGIIKYNPPVSDVKPFLQEAHCIINPSYHEGMSNVLLEAAASARPCIASNCPGCNDIVEDGKNGYLVSPRSALDLADNIERFIHTPYAKRIAMGLEGRKKVEKEFDRNIVIKAYLEEINKVVK